MLSIKQALEALAAGQIVLVTSEECEDWGGDGRYHTSLVADIQRRGESWLVLTRGGNVVTTGAHARFDASEAHYYFFACFLSQAMP